MEINPGETLSLNRKRALEPKLVYFAQVLYLLTVPLPGLVGACSSFCIANLETQDHISFRKFPVVGAGVS